MTSRREFLHVAGSGSVAAWIALNVPAVRAAARAAREAADAGDSLRALAPAEAADLEAIAEQIFPAGDTPGAREVGVIRFIDQALDTFASESLPSIRAGLEELRERVEKRFPDSSSFSALSFELQTAALREIEDTPFFGVVRYLAIAGMFALPEYGGNRGGTGWEVLGFEDRFIWQPPFGYYDAEAHE